jgi:hypothetical protein
MPFAARLSSNPEANGKRITSHPVRTLGRTIRAQQMPPDCLAAIEAVVRPAVRGTATIIIHRTRNHTGMQLLAPGIVEVPCAERFLAAILQLFFDRTLP